MEDVHRYAFALKENFIEFVDNIKLSNEPKNRRCLLLSSSGQSHGLFFPFHYYRKELKRDFNFHFKEIICDDLSKKQQLIKSFSGGIVLVALPLRVGGAFLPKEEVFHFFRTIERAESTKIAYFDISDQSISPHFEVLPFVDLFLIHTVFKDPTSYWRNFLGANQFADFLSRKFAIEPTEANEYYTDVLYSQPKEDQINKICSSWNFIFWRSLVKTFRKQGYKCSHNKKREIDIHCRFNPYSGWCKLHRTDAANKLNALSPEYRVVASAEKIALKEFYEELENSKIVFSPFGWGEVCPKDYEAVMKGCLLMKPSMEHVSLSPEFYIPYQTYVPVEWDLSDLQKKTRYYLKDQDERERIINHASQMIERIFSEKLFLERVKVILDRLHPPEACCTLLHPPHQGRGSFEMS